MRGLYMAGGSMVLNGTSVSGAGSPARRADTRYGKLRGLLGGFEIGSHEDD